MERLQYWLGMKQRESVLQIIPSDTPEPEASKSPRPVGQTENSYVPPKSFISPGLRVDNHISETERPSQPLNSVSECVSNSPKDKKECVVCRVMGSAVNAGAAGYVLYEGWRNRNLHSGRKRLFYRGFCLSLSTFLMLMSVSVAFKMGFFQETEEGEKKDLVHALKLEYQTLMDKLHSLSSSSSSPKLLYVRVRIEHQDNTSNNLPQIEQAFQANGLLP